MFGESLDDIVAQFDTQLGEVGQGQTAEIINIVDAVEDDTSSLVAFGRAGESATLRLCVDSIVCDVVHWDEGGRITPLDRLGVAFE